MSTPYPPVRRVVTGHAPDGKAIVVDDSPVQPYAFGTSAFSDIFWTDEFPSKSDVEFKDLAKEHAKQLVNENGSNFRLVETPPGSVTPLHRTITIDYGILVKGTMTLILDDDKHVVLNEGDVVVQRATIHGWKNEGTDWARMFFVMLPSQKPKIGDTEFEAEFRQ